MPGGVDGPAGQEPGAGLAGEVLGAEVKLLSLKPPCCSEICCNEETGMTVCSAGNRLGRIHSGMAIWTAAKMARVTAIAGTVRRISAPAVTPRAKPNAA